jgi:hypothetical protein
MSMPSNVKSKSAPHLDILLQDCNEVSAYGGAVLVDAIARDSGLWDHIRDLSSSLDHRSDTSRGNTPEVLIAQILTSFATGGFSIEDAGRLAQDPALGKLIGLDSMADASTLNLWLNRQTEQGVEALWEINRKLLAWVFKQLPKSTLCPNGKAEVFFDGTEIEVEGKCFEKTAINYDGNRAYSWQTLWLNGKWILGAKLDAGNEDVSKHLRPLLLETKDLWHPYAETGEAHFFADSGSSAGKYLTIVDHYNWSWTISYNKWTDKLDNLSAALPESDWGPQIAAVSRKGEDILEQHSFVRHQPGEDCIKGHDFAVVRYQAATGGELLYRYAYVACGQASKVATPVTDPAASAATFAYHKTKGAHEHVFSNILSDLDLHHPPCKRFLSNEAWYALGAIANNLLRAVQALALPEDKQAMRLRSIIRECVVIPVRLTKHAGRSAVKVFITRSLQKWASEVLEKVWPKRARGGQIRNTAVKPDRWSRRKKRGVATTT